MAEAPERRQVYYIPDNYIKENRVRIGQISFRFGYLFDSILLSLILGVLAVLVVVFLMEKAQLSSKITVVLIICGPGFLLGQIGYNGDRITTAFSYFMKWKKNNGVRIYNTNPRLLGSDPVDDVQGGYGRDAIVETVNNIRAAMRKKSAADDLIEGKTFEFEYDPFIDGYTEGAQERIRPEGAGYIDLDNVQIDSNWDPSAVKFAFSADGYNEADEDEDDASQYESN